MHGKNINLFHIWKVNSPYLGRVIHVPQKPETAEICRKMSVKLVVKQMSVRATRALRAIHALLLINLMRFI